MAKEPAKKEAASAKPEAGAKEASPKKGGGMKVGIVVGLVLLLEVATVVMTMMMSGGPKAAEGHATATEPDLHAEDGKLIEILVVKDQFPNQRTGRVYLYDTEIWITVQKRESDKVKKQVEGMQAALATDIAVIFRRAEPAQLMEPSLATLTRQLKAALDERLGKDTEGHPIVQEAFLKKCIQFRADG